MGISTQLALALPASIPSPPSELSKFSIGPLTIHAYALCILAGILMALWLTNKRMQARGGNSDMLWDIAIWAIPFGIIGGRLYHVMITDPMYYFGLGGQQAHWAEIPQLWLGGLGIMGAVSLGALGAWIGCRKAGIRLSAFADAAVPGLLLAQAIGRWGNWFNQELFGAPTKLPWGLEIDPNSYNFPAGLPADTLFHPTFLYESLWNVLGALVLIGLDRKFKLRRGAMFCCYMIWYGIGRTFTESLRLDPAEIITIGPLGLRVHQWLAIALVVAGAIALFLVLKRTRSQDADPFFLPGRKPEAAAEGANPAGTEASADAAGEGPQEKNIE
ncbi:prolipoprotein diacylglyceryl transferase [Glutamicibacter halophytocola]|uniref:Phosphatidylglycerol--prolipoprotein diacylglyceryl transferase n=1 Tax=Glutamicibacter halophytocola TaxID=1933880 RepID=A0ABX5Y618_9MICC|nr:prolipoprotein diacylglyceryl transferase [Glutamicibacter halophytocola]QDY65558.1 prolipoprotein diacylglyceryl transferase [Glutamicibacter halophytocola]